MKLNENVSAIKKGALFAALPFVLTACPQGYYTHFQELADPIWASDGRALYFRYANRDISAIYLWSSDTGARPDAILAESGITGDLRDEWGGGILIVAREVGDPGTWDAPRPDRKLRAAPLYRYDPAKRQLEKLALQPDQLTDGRRWQVPYAWWTRNQGILLLLQVASPNPGNAFAVLQDGNVTVSSTSNFPSIYPYVPYLSPDKTRTAYFSHEFDRSGNLVVMDVSSPEQKRALNVPSGFLPVGWIDQDHIAISSPDMNETRSVSVIDGKVASLINQGIRYVRQSPSGDRLAIIDGQGNLAVSNSDGAEFHVIVSKQTLPKGSQYFVPPPQ